VTSKHNPRRRRKITALVLPVSRSASS
jgi:hypothetical protein